MIGIISYLPDDKITRDVRYERFKKLLHDLDKLFPKEHVLVVAQNYTDTDLAGLGANIEVKQYGKLGIINARNTLRQIFLDRNDDYLIMFDDDSELEWHEDDAGEQFINCLLTNKYGIVFSTFKSCKAVGIRREVIQSIEFRSIDGRDYGEDLCFGIDLLNHFDLLPVIGTFFDDCMKPYIIDNSLYGNDLYSTYKITS